MLGFYVEIKFQWVKLKALQSRKLLMEFALDKRPQVSAVACKQWLPEWNDYLFSSENARRRPPQELLVFSMSAKQLRRLSGVYERRRDGGDASGIQRLHEKARSIKIGEYVKAGYPFCDLPTRQKANEDNAHLKKPGWLPTAIVVNILKSGEERRGKSVAHSDLVDVEKTEYGLKILMPEGSVESEWAPQSLAPIEIIDGQHRLFSFDETSQLPDDFELPVVGFHGLDVGWQAYLFWSINVSPKKINPSHAYDLFPLLRTQDWLENASSVHVYREARSQELTDLLYRHPSSPWKGRINMLGERKSGWVSQAGWVQSIFNSFLSPGSVGRSRKGLFAANLSQTSGPLDWSRPQQAAFLIFIWSALRDAVKAKTDGWAKSLRDQEEAQIDFLDDHDPAFLGSKTLLNQEQGVRGFCLVMNDLLFREADRLQLNSWESGDVDIGDTQVEDIESCLSELRSQPFFEEVKSTVSALAEFDWRSSDAPGLDEVEVYKKSAFRGTGGYGRVRQELLMLLSQQGLPLSAVAQNILSGEKF